MKVTIQYEDQFGYFRHYTVMNHLPSARRTAQSKSSSTGKRFRLVDENGALLDLIYP